MKVKQCINCKQFSSISNFHKNGRGGFRPRCKVCQKIRFPEKPKRRWKKYANDAKRRELSFDLTEDEFSSFSKVPCHYCGGEVGPIRLDRINNNLGYTISNVVSCCYLCNLFKHTFTKKEFLQHVEKIYLHQNNDD